MDLTIASTSADRAIAVCDTAMRHVHNAVAIGEVPAPRALVDEGGRVSVEVRRVADLDLWRHYLGARYAVQCGTVGTDRATGRMVAQTGFSARVADAQAWIFHAEALPPIADCPTCVPSVADVVPPQAVRIEAITGHHRRIAVDAAGRPVMVPAAQTFHIVASSGEVLGTDEDVPLGVHPEEFGRRIADNRGAVFAGIQAGLSFFQSSTGWSSYPLDDSDVPPALPIVPVWKPAAA